MNLITHCLLLCGSIQEYLSNADPGVVFRQQYACTVLRQYTFVGYNENMWTSTIMSAMAYSTQLLFTLPPTISKAINSNVACALVCHPKLSYELILTSLLLLQRIYGLLESQCAAENHFTQTMMELQ